MSVFAMPVNQILTGDGGDSGVFGYNGVGIVGAVGKLDGFAMGDFADLIVAPRDAVVLFFLSDVDLVGAELGIAQHVHEGLKDVVEIALQARKADRSGVGTAAGFYLGGADFQEVVELVAGLGFGAASAPDLAVDVDQTDLGGRFVD